MKRKSIKIDGEEYPYELVKAKFLKLNSDHLLYAIECLKEDGFDFFQFWILTGFLFGVRKMNLILLPKNFGIGESIGILILNLILGGIIGGVVLCFMIVKIFMELILVLLETFVQK